MPHTFGGEFPCRAVIIAMDLSRQITYECVATIITRSMLARRVTKYMASIVSTYDMFVRFTR